MVNYYMFPICFSCFGHEDLGCSGLLIYNDIQTKITIVCGWVN